MVTGWRIYRMNNLILHVFNTLLFLATDLISHHLLQVNAGHRLAAANALRHAFFEVWLHEDFVRGIKTI
jgi:hypothetical protein